GWSRRSWRVVPLRVAFRWLCRRSGSIFLTSVDAFDAPVSRARTSIEGNHNPATQSPHSRPIRGHHGRRTRIKGTGMTEQQNVLAAEREEIATRVASFKATQEKFQREREEYFVATLQKAQRIRTPAIVVLGTTLRSD